MKLDVVSNPELDSDGNLVHPYNPQPDPMTKINVDIMLLCYVAYTGDEPNVYMTFKGVIIPTTKIHHVSDLSSESCLHLQYNVI